MRGMIAVLGLLASSCATSAHPSATYNCTTAVDYAQSHRGLAVLVLKDGIPVCSSAPATLEEPHELWSGTKSFLGLIAAAAVQDGLLTLDEPVAQTIVEWANDAERGRITIRHLLSMTSGQASVIGRPPTYVDALASPLTAPPGTLFQYGPTPPQLFGELMRRKLQAAHLDVDAQAYLQRRILTPLGVTSAPWRNGADGLPLMPQGASLSARDWARVGEFVRAQGRINNQPVVDPETFRQLFIATEANPAYGLSWWLANPTTASDLATQSSDVFANLDALPRDLVFAAGAGDQRLFVIPSRGLTIVRQARLDLGAASRGAPEAWSDTRFLALLLTPQ